MTSQAFPPLTTSVVATGTCEMPILSAHVQVPEDFSPPPLRSTPARAPSLAAALMRFRLTAKSARDLQECFAQLSATLAAGSLLNGLWWLEPAGDEAAVVDNHLRVLARWGDEATDYLWQAHQGTLIAAAARALNERQTVLTREARQVLIAVRIAPCGAAPSVIVASLAPANDAAQEAMVVGMALALEQAIADQRAESIRAQAAGLAQWLEMQRVMDQAQSFDEAAIILVNYLKALCGASHVALLTQDARGRLGVAAMSDLDQIDATAQSNKAMGLAAKALPGDQDFAHWPGEPGATLPSLEFKQCAAWLGCEGLVIVRLRHHQNTFGFLCVGTTALPADHQRLHHLMLPLVEGAAAFLHALRSAHASIASRAHRRLRGWLNDHAHRATRYGLAILVLLLAMPWPYRVSAPCQLELVKRRFIAAPFDGLLESCLVQSGDTVAEGQTLALMDGRQLRLELAAKQAEWASQQKRRESHLARGDVAQSQIAHQLLVALQAEIELLQKHLDELEIRSPVAGVVVSGDLQKAEGAPLKSGDGLFEVGPLDELIIELEIADTDVRHIRTGQVVSVMFDAFPMKPWRGEIARIHPRAETRDDEHVFVAEVRIPNPQHVLRPGLRGWARIHTGWSPLAWNLFHRPVERIAGWLPW